MKEPEQLESPPGISDRTAMIAFGVVLALLVWMMVLFAWTSDRNGLLVRILLWVLPTGFIVFSVVAWFMSPRTAKPKS